MSLLHPLYINLRGFFRILRLGVAILSFFVRGTLRYLSTSDAVLRRHKLIRNAQIVSQQMLRSFNVELICKQNIPEDEACLLVGNHLGFIDIVCLCSLRSNVFITSLEMKHTPILGQISELGGCAYVNRKSRTSIQEELKGMVDVLKQGFRVVLYAESVASNGEQVLPFKKTLIMSAGLSSRPIRPFVFNFRKVNGGPVLFEHRDALCWYGEETFLPAIWRSLKLQSVTCEIEFLPLVHPTPEEDRSELAKKIHALVSEKYAPFHIGMNQPK
jgi:lyso-ornithine lipid O-acyltransferase